jgi:hypothetical protein
MNHDIMATSFERVLVEIVSESPEARIVPKSHGGGVNKAEDFGESMLVEWTLDEQFRIPRLSISLLAGRLAWSTLQCHPWGLNESDILVARSQFPQESGLDVQFQRSLFECGPQAHQSHNVKQTIAISAHLPASTSYRPFDRQKSECPANPSCTKCKTNCHTLFHPPHSVFFYTNGRYTLETSLRLNSPIGLNFRIPVFESFTSSFGECPASPLALL